jgi:hypothetical protein
VVDTLGAWGGSAAEPLELIARAYAHRIGVGPSGMHMFYALFNATLVRHVARLLLANSGTGETLPVSLSQ